MNRRRQPDLARIFATALVATVALVFILRLSFRSDGPSHLPRPSALTRFFDTAIKNSEDWAEGAGVGDANDHDAWPEAQIKQNAADEENEEVGQMRDIVISGSMPSLEDLPENSAVAQAWREAIEAVETTAEKLREKLEALGATEGIPGTAIETNDERAELQRYLDCISSEGAWIYDPVGDHLWDGGRGGLTVHKQMGDLATCDKRHYKTTPNGTSWHVRESMRYRWEASSECKQFLSSARQVAGAQTIFGGSDLPNPARLPSRSELCRLLRAKSMVIVADNPTGYLTHDLLLDWTVDAPLTCYGDQFCKEHLMCTGALKAKGGRNIGWSGDASPFVKPDLPPGPSTGAPRRIYERSPAEPPTELPTRGRNTMLRYRRSDGGFLRSSPSVPEHDPTFVHPATGVREFNNYALALARRSDIVMYSKAPLPVPVAGSIFDSLSEELMGDSEWEGEHKAVKAIQLAAALTTRVWLPELAESLKALRHPAHDHLVVYRGTWRSQPDCASSSSPAWKDGEPKRHWPNGDGPAPYPHAPTLRQLIFPSSAPGVDLDLNTPLTEPYALLYNLQTILQNHAARRSLLPTVGVPFLDVETPLSVWRSGFVAGSEPANCLQTCIPSPGQALEHAIIGGLFRVMERGWDADEARTSSWVGDGYRTVVQREAGGR